MYVGATRVSRQFSNILWYFFSRMLEQRQQLVTAVVERLLPSDLGIGARETGAAEYVERVIESSPRQGIEQILELLDQRSREEFETPFEDIASEQQDMLLGEFAEHSDPAVSSLFRTLVTLALEGFLCRPDQGGNRDALGWRFMGYGEAAPWPGDCLYPRTTEELE